MRISVATRSLTLVALSLSIGAATAGAQSAGPLIGYVDSVVGAAIAKHQTAGAAVLVESHGRTLLAKGYGLADIENDVPVTPQTVFRIGSVTKQFTSAAIMRLVEQGKLSLDDTLQKFFPAYATHGNRVTVRHLLNHTSGIKNYTSMGPRWTSTMRLDMSHDSLVALFAAEPFDFKPGDKWLYDNSGYFLLGMIIEKVSGKPYGTYLQDEFFGPLGLTGTRYCDQRPLIKHRAQGYSPAPDGFLNADMLSMTQPYAAGSLCSTVVDLAAWTRALSSGKVVSAASYAQMSTPGKLNDGSPLRYAFGLVADSLGGHLDIHHNGGINGFISEVHHFPKDSVIVVVLTNTEGPAAPQLAKQIGKRALGIPEPIVKDLPIAAAEIARVSGEYLLGPVTFKVFADGATLKAQAQAPGQDAFRLKSQGGSLFVADFDPEITLDFAAGDPAPSFVFTQGAKRTATRKR